MKSFVSEAITICEEVITICLGYIALGFKRATNSKMDEIREMKGQEPGHKRKMIKQFFQSANRNVNIRSNTRHMSHTRLISESTDDDDVDTTTTAANVSDNDDHHEYDEEAAKLATATAQKTKELGQTVNDSVIKPTTDKVKEGTLLNDMSSSMSSFATKLSSVGTKGWKDVSNIFGDKPRSGESGPGEGTSLLGGGANKKTGNFESNQKPLLREKDSDDWSGWGDDWGSSKNKQSENGDEWDSWSNEQSVPQSSSKSPVSDDDGWNTQDWGSGFDSISSSKKPLTPSPRSKSKKNELKPNKRASEAATANLIDFGGSDNNKSNNEWENNWDNEVWANEEEEEWQSLEVSSTKKSPSKNK